MVSKPNWRFIKNLGTISVVHVVCSLSSDLNAAELTEIVVTAEKREALLQETPVAVSVVTRDMIQLRNLQDFADIQFATPSLVFSEISDMAQVTIRGVGVDLSAMDAEPGVALYSDGVYRGGLVSSGSLLFDLERIEVLRGPQGTLFGRNSTGGALNVVTRMPGEIAAFDASVIYGDYDRSRVEVGGDIPLIQDALAVRVALAHDQHDGYSDNNLTGREEDDAEASFAKIAFLASPNETVSAALRLEYGASDIGGPPYVRTDENPVPPLLLSTSNPGGVLNVPGTLCGPISCADALGLELSPPGIGSRDPRELYSDGSTLFERESFGASLTVDASISNDVTFESVTSFFDIDQDGDQSNNDGVNIEFLTNDFDQQNKEWSQEFSLSGESDSLDWIAGLYYYESDVFEAFRFTLPALQPTFEAIFGLLGGGQPLSPGSLSFFGARLDGSTSPVPFLELQMYQDLESQAAYAQGTYSFSERIRGTAGVRWTRDEKRVRQTIGNNIGSESCRNLELKDDWDEVTGKVGLDLDLNDNTLFFASVSTGFKAGGLNGGLCNNPYDPENLIAYEVGSKSRLLNNTLQLNLTAFYYDYQDMHARLFVNNAAKVENATDAESYGAEIEWLWLVSENFRFDGSVSFLKSEIKDFRSTDPLLPQIGSDCNPLTGLDCLQDLSGNSLLRAPELKVSASAEYDISLGASGLLTLRGEYAFTDEMYHTVFNNSFARQDDFSLTNFRAIWTPSVTSELDGLSVIGFLENIDDREFVMIHTPNATTGGTISQFGPPRIWGLQFRYSY